VPRHAPTVDAFLRRSGSAYLLRISIIDPDPAMAGRQIQLSLGTDSAEEAEKRRNLILRALLQAGLVAQKSEPRVREVLQ
jgi:hypothetical protein